MVKRKRRSEEAQRVEGKWVGRPREVAGLSTSEEY
jgi:hypothetical protein